MSPLIWASVGGADRGWGRGNRGQRAEVPPTSGSCRTTAWQADIRGQREGRVQGSGFRFQKAAGANAQPAYAEGFGVAGAHSSRRSQGEGGTSNVQLRKHSRAGAQFRKRVMLARRAVVRQVPDEGG
jgi:hypothetical protein